MNSRFTDIYVSREGRYSLGQDTQENQRFLSIPVANQMVDYEEYYRLTESQYSDFLGDERLAAKFADECRERRHDGLLVLKPGTDRGVAI